MSIKSPALRVAVFTGSRAEYGLMRHLIRAIKSDDEFELQLMVGGSHLSLRYGGTLSEVVEDGNECMAKIEISLESDSDKSIAELTAETLVGSADALKRLKSDLLIVLGDRYETFAAASAAHLVGIPVVHLHGGETTSGALDDRLRHAISQLSTLHFTAAEEYRERVIAMGHPKEMVLNIGPMALDFLVNARSCTRSSFEKRTGYRFGEWNLLVTFHPETLLVDNGEGIFLNLMSALDSLKCNILFTYPNADPGSDVIIRHLERYVARSIDRIYSVKSLGQEQYANAISLFDGVVGNSSSGVIECALAGIPVLNIGNRQEGRKRYGEVIDVQGGRSAISRGLEELRARKSLPRRASKNKMLESPSMQIIRKLKDLRKSQ